MPDKRNPHPLNNEPITKVIMAMAAKMEALGNRYTLEPLGISSAMLKILYVLDETNATTPTEIMRYTGGSKSNTSQRLDVLEKKGFICRQAPSRDADQRQVRIAMTEEGEKQFRSIRKDLSHKSMCLEHGFSKTELKSWFDFMKKLSRLLADWESSFDANCPITKHKKS